MTDPDLADATYIEPITPEIVAKIIEKERHVVPGGFALLPTMGGQTALNCALSLNRMGVLEKFDVEMIGAKAAAIDKAEDRELFREAMQRIGLATPKAAFVNMHEMSKRLATAHASGMATADRQRLLEEYHPQRPHAGARGDTHHRAAGGRAPVLHARRHRRRHRLHDRRALRARARRRRRLADQRGADRGIGRRLEGVRDGGRPRQATTIASSSARSRTSIRWACIPAIRSPSRRR